MKRKTKTRIGQQIIASLRGFVEKLESDCDIETTFNCRSFEVDASSFAYDTLTAKRTRQLLGASQAVFARFLGVSVQSVRAWEQGINEPSDIAKRFMDEIRLNPDYWRGRLAQLVVAKKQRATSASK